jgi:DNA-directed RNA polymerase specialized sigma24 family protein
MPTSELSGSHRAIFTTSRWAIVLASARSQNPDGPEALTQLCRTYWKPVFRFVRGQGHAVPEAQELVEEFFADLLALRVTSPADRPHGRFRTFLLASLQRFLASNRARMPNERRTRELRFVPLEADALAEMESHGSVPAGDPAEAFDVAWARSVFDLSLDRLQNEAEVRGRRNLLEELEMYLTGEFPDAEKEKLAAMSIRLGVSVPMVKISISRLRQRFREFLREEVAGTIARPNELDDELLYLRRRLSATPALNGAAGHRALE